MAAKIVSVPSDNTLIEHMNTNFPILDKFKETNTIIFNCSVSKLWDLAFEDDCKLPFV